MIETLLGGLLGGAFRLAPEILKWLDRKGERGHELAMQDKALEFEKIRGAQRMAAAVMRCTARVETTSTAGTSARSRAASSSSSRTRCARSDSARPIAVSPMPRPVRSWTAPPMIASISATRREAAG